MCFPNNGAIWMKEANGPKASDLVTQYSPIVM